jgi:hypothetical protein
MGKKNKKAKAGKLPKTIAGVKVPKELRDVGGVLSRLARDPAAREVALAALTAALAVRKDNRKKVRDTVDEAGGAVEKAAGWVGPALTAAAVEAGRMLIDAYEGGAKPKKQAEPGANGEDREQPKALGTRKQPGAPVAH